MLQDGGLDGFRERATVANASGATVADEMEAERVKILLQIGGLKVIGDHARAGAERGLHDGVDGEAALDGFFGEQCGGQHHAGVGGVGATGDGGDDNGAVAEICFTIAIKRHGGSGGIEGIRLTAKPTVGHGAGEGFVESLFHLRQLDAVLRSLGAGDAAGDGAEVEREVRGVIHLARFRDAEEALGAVVIFVRRAMLVRAAGGAEVIDRFFVDGKVAHRRAVLGGHVGDGGAVGEAEGLGTGAVEFDELANHPVGAKNFRDAEGEVGGGDSFGEGAVEVNADHFRNEEGDGLAEHAGLGFDAAHAPTDDADAVDHGGVRIGADKGVGVVNLERGF